MKVVDDLWSKKEMGLMVKSKGKARTLRRHSLRRADTRYDLQLSDNKLEEIVALIQQQKGKFLGSQSRRVSHWEVEYCGKLLKVVYDRQRKQVITFLP